jgi:hypothetical protein
MEDAFAEAGFKAVKRISKASSGGIPQELVHSACLEESVRWALTVYTNFNEGRFSWRFGVYDAQDKAFRGEDAFVVYLYAGLSSRNAIEQSAQQVADHWKKSFAVQGFDGNFAAQKQQRFTSSQEGVMVYFGDDEGLFLGSIEGGSLTAPHILFTEGAPVYGTLAKKGFWTKPFSLPRGITDKPMRLPVLQKVTHHTFGFLYEFRGSKQYGIDLEYRYNVLPDRLFLKLDWIFWMDPDFSDKTLLAPELRLGAGLYLLPKRDWPVRLLAGAGASILFPGDNVSIVPLQEEKIIRFFFDPLWVGLEYHFPQVALKTEVRFPILWEAAGKDDWYFRAPDQDSLPVYVSIGVMIKW